MRILKGTYTTPKAEYALFYVESGDDVELRIGVYTGETITVIAAYKRVYTRDLLQSECDEYCFKGLNGKELFNMINKGCSLFSGRKTKGVFIQCEEGALLRKTFNTATAAYTIDKLNKKLYGCDIAYTSNGKQQTLDIRYTDVQSLTQAEQSFINRPLKYILLTKEPVALPETAEPTIRSLDVISLMKDTSWLKNKDYYVVTDDADAEELISTLENYTGPIAYDTETTGLRINMFSKINGKYANQLKESGKSNEVRVDKLVGVIFCTEPDTSYYLPCGNRKFRNLYADGEVRERLITNFKAQYTVGALRDADTDMADYWRKTPPEAVTPDCILMERCRKILEQGYIVTHNGTFDWKVAYCYDIDTNLCEDTMIMHQLMFKYQRSNTKRGESSALKHLAKVELGIDQLSLEDFFVGYKEREDKGKAKAASTIDFSYMDYEGAKAYAPADGDMTLSIYLKYKEAMLRDYKDISFIYGIEVLVSCAIGYMEFYGHRIDEHKIQSVRESKELELLCLESEIRDLAGIRTAEELKAYNQLVELGNKMRTATAEYNKAYDTLEGLKSSIKFNPKLQSELNSYAAVYTKAKQASEDMRSQLDTAKQKLKDSMGEELNLGAAGQVADLFYNKLGIIPPEGKRSVAKDILKPLSQEMETVNGELVPKYPIVNKYREWKDTQSLLTKFFGSLPEFMYPGGFIFSHYGQIQAATGRMSCSKPNAQQYCKAVTEIVVPRDNFIFFDADYSQIEYRTLVALADEPGLKKSFADPDSDYHTSMASLMFDIPYEQVDKSRRSAAKSFNFGIPYGMGIKSLAKQLHGNASAESVADAKEKYELYFKNQPKVKHFFDKVKEAAVVNGYTETLWKRKRYYTFTNPDGTENRKQKSSALRQAGNAVIQGCLDGDTLIQTKEYGIIKIKDAVNQHLLVWDGDKWSNGDILYSGKKQKCIVHFSNGQKFICSPIHKFLVKSAKGNERFVECKDLVGSDSSANPHRVVINRRYEPSDCNYNAEMLIAFIKSRYTIEGVSSEGAIEFNFQLSHIELCPNLQRALLFYGIRSTYCAQADSRKIVVCPDDAEKFLNLISCTTETKGNKGESEHTAENALTVQSVEITDEYIDMYDVCNTDGGYYVADGIITHNTAADIFKISVARNWNWIRRHKLYGKVIIVNMIHDEQLIEIDCDHINVLRAFADIVENMQFEVADFPPLYVGGGIGFNWKYAKGGDAEVHPVLARQFSNESKKYSLLDKARDRKQWFNWFDTRVKTFRKEKVAGYITDQANFGKAIHPSVLSLLTGDFSYGAVKLDTETDQEWLKRLFNQFCEKNNVNANFNNFISSEVPEADEEPDKVYNDGDDDDEIILEDDDSLYAQVTENGDCYGIRPEDLIFEFGIYVSKAHKLCGIRIDLITESNFTRLADYLAERMTDKECEGALELGLLDSKGELHKKFWVNTNAVELAEVLGVDPFTNRAA